MRRIALDEDDAVFLHDFAVRLCNAHLRQSRQKKTTPAELLASFSVWARVAFATAPPEVMKKAASKLKETK